MESAIVVTFIVAIHQALGTNILLNILDISECATA